MSSTVMNSTGKTPLIDIRGLAKSFGANKVLNGIDFHVDASQVVVVIGPSGSGKSTFLRCCNGLEIPEAGSVDICGKRLVDNGKMLPEAELNELRKHVGMVFQGFNLWPHLSVIQNVMEAPIYVKGMAKDQARAIAEQLLEKVGMSERKDAYPFTLSGGQKQRVAIARALAMSPEVILFDEPTSALDPERVGEVLQVMKNLSSEGYTMIVVTHEMEFARAVSDQVVFLEKGLIIEKSAPDKFFSNPDTERVRKFLELSH